MKSIVISAFLLVLSIPAFPQEQLNLQGNPESQGTVANIKVNYNGKADVIGLRVESIPSGPLSLYGIGGYFLGGKKGIEGKSDAGIGVSGISAHTAGVSGYSVSGPGVFGESNTNYGVIGSSTNFYGLYGESTNSYGVYGRGDNEADFWAHNGTYGNSSSRRWKNNIQNIDSPIEKISKLRGVYFDWDKEHGGKHSIGFIAEEVGDVLPEIVFYEENGIDAKGLDYNKITLLLVEALNALNKKHDDEIAALKEENELLKYRLDKIYTILQNLGISETQE